MSLLLWNLICRLITCGSRVYVSGEDNIPPGPKIFVCNHPTSFDPCYFYRFTGNAAILMTKFVFDLPFAGSLMNGCEFVPVDIRQKGIKRKSCYALALNTLLKGRNLIIAPEGKLSESVPGRRTHKGAARLARASGCPIIPMGLRHEGEVRQFYIKDQRVRFMPKGKTFLNIGMPYHVYSDDLEWHTESIMANINVLATH